MDLTEAVRLVCADLRNTDPRRTHLADLQLLDVAVDDVEADEIDAALAAGEISSATAAAYNLVWDAKHADLIDALLVEAR